MKTLIAEDDRVTRRMLEVILTEWGYKVVTACDGIGARHILQSEDPPKLAVIDWMMPGVPGIDLCREVRNGPEQPYIYILLLTAKDQKADIIAGLEAGADDYLTKPFDEYELKARLSAGRRITELQARLQAAATRDPLTGLWNHGTIYEFLGKELARGRRKGTPTGVILADLDHFKQVNDTHGHLTGDVALRETARRMQATLRLYDGIGRYGGEEFLIVAPECAPAGVLHLAERLRQSISETPIDVPEARLCLTVSLGVVSGGDAAGLKDTDAYLRAADNALYQAKAAGRNRVMLGSPH